MSIDHSARLDVHDLLARFCRCLDLDCPRVWLDLFCHDATIECGEQIVQGREQIAELPALLRAKNGGEVRHLIMGVVIDRGEQRRDLNVTAYGPVLDFSQGGVVIGFYDYAFELHQSNRWSIRRVRAVQVGASVPDLGTALFARAQGTTGMLQRTN